MTSARDGSTKFDTPEYEMSSLGPEALLCALGWCQNRWHGGNRDRRVCLVKNTDNLLAQRNPNLLGADDQSHGPHTSDRKSNQLSLSRVLEDYLISCSRLQILLTVVLHSVTSSATSLDTAPQLHHLHYECRVLEFRKLFYQFYIKTCRALMLQQGDGDHTSRGER